MVGVFYYFYVIPTEAEMATREKQLNALRTDIAKGASTAAQLPQFKRAGERTGDAARGLKAVLPGTQGCGRPASADSDAGDAIEPCDSRVQAPSVTKQLHEEWPIQLQLDGTYHNLAMFFDRVSKFSRIINVSNISIRGKEKPDATSTITVDCTATTFVLLEAAKPAAAKAN
jgi:Tfp pilus assembly protein PilO